MLRVCFHITVQWIDRLNLSFITFFFFYFFSRTAKPKKHHTPETTCVALFTKKKTDKNSQIWWRKLRKYDSNFYSAWAWTANPSYES
jgi:hypothetical protein